MSEPVSKITLVLKEDLVERLRNAAYWREEQFAHIVDRALRLELRRMEHSNGKKYKQREEELKVGRPKSVVAAILALIIPMLAACSHWKETPMAIQGDRGKWEFTKDQYGQMHAAHPDVHFIVLESSTSAEWWSSQPGTTAVKHCKHKYDSEQVAAMRTAVGSGVHVSEYADCQYQIKREAYRDQPLFTLWEKPLSMAALGAGLAYGLSNMGGDTVSYNQEANGFGGAGGSARAYGGTANAYAKGADIDIRKVYVGH